MPINEQRRKELETRGGDIYRRVLRENRSVNEQEQMELRSIELELDRAQYEMLYGEPPTDEARQRFTQTIETRGAEQRTVLAREHRMADAVRGSYPTEHEQVSIGRLLRGYVMGDWASAELEARVMASSPTTAGGILIPTPLSSRIIDMARNQSSVMRAGMATVPMGTATLKMARVTGDVTAGFYSEAAAITASDAAFDSVTFTARKMAVLVAINNELLEDAAGVDSAIEMSIARAVALKLDLVGLNGSGTPPEPKGIRGVTGVNTVTSFGTPADYDKFLTAIYEVRKDNFEPNAIVYSPRTAESLAKLKTGLSGDKTPLAMPNDFAGLTKIVSGQVVDNLGTGTNESYAVLGQWNQFAMGVRRNLTIEVAREGSYDVSGTHYSAFQKDQTLLRATLRVDFQCFQPTAFTLMSGITVG